MKRAIQSQQGIGLLGLFLLLALIAFCVTVIMKLGPAYMEYLTIRSVMQELNEEPTSVQGGRRSILGAIDKRLNINSVENVSVKDFKLERKDHGYDVNLDYEVREHLFANIDVVLTFNPRVYVGDQ